jgi:hypothetical protein
MILALRIILSGAKGLILSSGSLLWCDFVEMNYMCNCNHMLALFRTEELKASTESRSNQPLFFLKQSELTKANGGFRRKFCFMLEFLRFL